MSLPKNVQKALDDLRELTNTVEVVPRDFHEISEDVRRLFGILPSDTVVLIPPKEK